ncbi:unnamed protein product [Acidithrix sp. C25]|nr:unnamed protein product [Acidithrix sp. C25]
MSGDTHGPFRGTIEVFTGGGKSLIALKCIERAARESPELKVAIVAPTSALARQWIDVINRHSDLNRSEIGLLGSGSKGDLESSRVLICVLNSASRLLPEMSSAISGELMLVIDECHRAGAPSMAKVLNTKARFRLGLSATPERDEASQEGTLISFDDQLVGKSLGAVVYHFDLKQARNYGWLPNYEINHHGVHLTVSEQAEYERLTRRVDDSISALQDIGVEISQARIYQTRNDEVGSLAKRYVSATTQRKDFLYKSTERIRVATRIVSDSFERNPDRRALVFHERVDSATQLARALELKLPSIGITLENSKLKSSVRNEALASFRTGTNKILVSVKSLIEGIDVPEADLGVLVASSSSIRQRIQTLGRVLRRQFEGDGSKKIADMHIIYVSNTVDEAVYGKLDWTDLTGPESNKYWEWLLEPNAAPIQKFDPPQTPTPSESQEWKRLCQLLDLGPQEWRGGRIGVEHSLDTLGTVRRYDGKIVSNPQGVSDIVDKVRSQRGGRFYLTPEFNLILVSKRNAGENMMYVAGKINEPFVYVTNDIENQEQILPQRNIKPGDLYYGPTDATGGSFQIRSKGGGLIERRANKSETEFAIIDENNYPQQSQNAIKTIKAWKLLLDRGIKISVNHRDDVWYVNNGSHIFLEHVPGGFLWQSDLERGS